MLESSIFHRSINCCHSTLEKCVLQLTRCSCWCASNRGCYGNPGRLVQSRTLGPTLGPCRGLLESGPWKTAPEPKHMPIHSPRARRRSQRWTLHRLTWCRPCSAGACRTCWSCTCSLEGRPCQTSGTCWLMHIEHAVNGTFHQPHLVEVIRAGDQFHQSFDGSAASQLLYSSNNKFIVDLPSRRVAVCKLLTEDAENVLWRQTLPTEHSHFSLF